MEVITVQDNYISLFSRIEIVLENAIDCKNIHHVKQQPKQ